jgi:hypothetical protein
MSRSNQKHQKRRHQKQSLKGPIITVAVLAAALIIAALVMLNSGESSEYQADSYQEILSHLKKKEYQSVISEADQFISISRDEDKIQNAIRWRDQAETKLKEQQEAAAIAALEKEKADHIARLQAVIQQKEPGTSEHLEAVRVLYHAAPEKARQSFPVLVAKIRAPEIRAEKIKSQFSAWNGSHVGFVRMIKDAMHDPGSFEHIETRYKDESDHLVVVMDFRGKNQFGALVRNRRSATFDLNGNFIKELTAN